MEGHVSHEPVSKRAKHTNDDEFVAERCAEMNADVDIDDEPTADEVADEHSTTHLSEGDVGIEQYVCDYPGIGGIIKQRYADFIVREIDKNGKVVYLSSTECLVAEEKGQQDADDGRGENLGNGANTANPLPLEDFNKLNDFLAGPKQPDAKDHFLLLSADDDKEHRKLVHMFIKDNYANLDTETVQNEREEKIVKVFFREKNQKQGRRQRRQRNNDQKQYCHFVLYKENRDTMSAVNLIADLLRVKASLFSYAGTKDKRAITTQQLCACRIDAKRLAPINKMVKNIAVGSFEYKSFPLKLGELSGNHFSIVLRNISTATTEESLSTIIESLRDKGFINYFGMQRFGSGAVPTFEIGKAVLRSDWESVIKLILSPRPQEDAAVYDAKKHWVEKGDSKGALEIMKRRRCIEGKVLDILAKQGEKSFYNSFQGISRNMRLMYLHSYQSCIWNKIVSKRIKLFGMQPIVGDLVLSKNADSGAPENDSMTRCQVRMLTETDLASEEYTITDIVVPLPGYDVTYPGFGAKGWYSELLAADGLSLESMRHNLKEYSLSGAYRFMVVKPSNIDWSIAVYDDYKVPLLRTDLDIIHDKNLPSSTESGNFKALKLDFGLPTSSYATMVIREITRLDTSTHRNMELNV